MNKKISITSVENGYILETPEEDYVFQHDGDEKPAFIMLVHKLAEELGFNYDKFAENNLEVSFNKKGHKIN